MKGELGPAQDAESSPEPSWLTELSLSRNLCLPSHDCIRRLQRTQGPWYFLVVLD